MTEYERISLLLKKSNEIKKKSNFFTVGMWAMFACVLTTSNPLASWFFLIIQISCGFVSVYYIRKATKILKEN